MEVTWTVSVRDYDGKWSEKPLNFTSASEINVESLRKSLDIPLSKEYTVLCQNREGIWQVLETDKDLGI